MTKKGAKGFAAKWTPARREKFMATLAAKKKRAVRETEIPLSTIPAKPAKKAVKIKMQGSIPERVALDLLIQAALVLLRKGQ